MVMHARKYPRLSDGYYKAGQTHPYEEKNSSKHHHYDDRYGNSQHNSPNDRYSNTDDRSRDRADPRSSDRYVNKASYTERNKQKEKAAIPMDKHVNSERVYKVGKDGRNREQKVKDQRAEVRKSAVRVCGDWSEHVSSSGKYYYYNCKTEVSRWEKPKEWDDKLADSLSKSVRSNDRRLFHGTVKKDDRTKHSVSATATSGFSGEHHPSNSRAALPFGSPGTTRPHSDHSELKYRQSHSLHSSTGSATNSKTGNSSHRTVNSRPGSDHAKRDAYSANYLTPERPSSGSEHRGNNSGAQSRHHAHGGRHAAHSLDYNGSKHVRQDGHQQSEDMDISPGSTPTEESVMDRIATTPNNTSTPMAHPTGTPPSASRIPTSSMLSMLSSLTSMSSISDIPALASLSSLTATSPGGSVTSPNTLLPQLLQQLASASGRSMPGGQPHANQQVLKQAIAVLQQMHETLLMQQKQQQQRQLQQLLVTQLHQLQEQLQQQQTGSKPNTTPQLHPTPQHALPHTPHLAQQATPQQHSLNNSDHRIAEDGNQSPYSPPDESDGTPLQSPEHNNGINTSGIIPHQNIPDRLRESPHSEHSLKSSRLGSPVPSHTSSQNILSLGTSQLSAAHHKHDTVHLSSSLAQYYDDNLIGHVAGLIYPLTEKQADLISEEAHTIGSMMVSQVSVELKGARSLVRAGEIISTSHEQRILFIRQQIKDLDNWRTQTTFMPSVVTFNSSQPTKEET